MRSTLLYQIFIILFMMATLVDAATITKRQDDSSADDMVTLDVRGTLFPTKKSTLLKVKGGYFDAMLTGHWPANDKGHYVIDEDPKYFRWIMAYLVYGKYPLSSDGSINIDHLNQLFDYFLIPVPVRWDSKFRGHDLTLLKDHRLVESMSNQNGFRGVQSMQPTSRFSVQIIKGRRAYIGFAPRLGFRKDKENFKTCGWYVSVPDGKLWAQGDIHGERFSGTKARDDTSNRIPLGSVVTAIHHTFPNGTSHMEFQVDGTSLGTAFYNVAHEEHSLFAAVDMSNDTEILIIDDYQPPSRTT